MASKTSKTFEMNFSTADGKSKKLSLRHAKEGISREEAKTSMETIASKDIFVKDGVDQFYDVKSANYVTRTVDEVYKAN